ncbi:MAG: hypothetical protein Q9168_003266 [Polycauliona sp. 1 TL-2023]
MAERVGVKMDFQASTDNDRRQGKRIVPMRCLMLGLGRTGTNSIRQALKQLGFEETYHMQNAFNSPKDNELWMQAIDAKFNNGPPFGKEKWDQLLGHCQAVTDYPSAMFGPELISTYPDAKIILNTRDVDRWYQYETAHTTQQTIDWLYKDPVLYSLSFVDHMATSWAGMFYKMWEIHTKNDFATHGKDAFAEHYQHIRDFVPAEKLLEWHVGEGWEPLCGFLGVKAPHCPFPNTNDQGSFRDVLRGWYKSRALAVLQKVLPWLLGVALVALSMLITFWVRS